MSAAGRARVPEPAPEPAWDIPAPPMPGGSEVSATARGTASGPPLPPDTDPAPAANVPRIAEHLTQRGGDPALLFRELTWKITNHLATRPREVQTALGPSEIGDPCARRIGHKLLGSPTRPLPPNFKAWVGSLMHEGLGEVLDVDNVVGAPDLGGIERWLVEVGVDVGEGITGTVDAYDQITATALDWKTCGPGMLTHYRRHGPSAVQQIQVHLYGLGLERAGHPVDNVMLIFLPRQGDLADAFPWHEPFDPDLARAALQRYAGIATVVEAIGEAGLEALPLAPSWCTHCPYLGEPAGCPGHPDARPPLVEPALTFTRGTS